jgi:hypothetical protein
MVVGARRAWHAPDAEVLGLPAVSQVLQVRRVLIHRGRRLVLQRFRGDAQLLPPAFASAVGCEGTGERCGTVIARTANLAFSAASMAAADVCCQGLADTSGGGL